MKAVQSFAIAPKRAINHKAPKHAGERHEKAFSLQERGEAEGTEREGSPMGAEKVLNLVVVA
jgi:hypothetical protein